MFSSIPRFKRKVSTCQWEEHQKTHGCCYSSTLECIQPIKHGLLPGSCMSLLKYPLPSDFIEKIKYHLTSVMYHLSIFPFYIRLPLETTSIHYPFCYCDTSLRLNPFCFQVLLCVPSTVDVAPTHAIMSTPAWIFRKTPAHIGAFCQCSVCLLHYFSIWSSGIFKHFKWIL